MKRPGSCAKVTTVAIIETIDGDLYMGTNDCMNPQVSCPRDERGCQTGEGYELCVSICEQLGHAEEVACRNTGFHAPQATLHLFGHYYFCKDCEDVMKRTGIQTVIFHDTGKEEELNYETSR